MKEANKVLSVKETQKDLIKILELPQNDFAIAEIMEEDKEIRVDFKFNMRNVVSNPTFFRQATTAMAKYQADLSLEPRERKSDGLFIELTVSMKAKELKP